MTKEETKQLLKRYNTDQCTEREKHIVEETLMQFNEDQPGLSEKRLEQLGSEIYKNLPGPDGKSRSIKLWSVIAAIASVSLVGISILMFYPRLDVVPVETNTVQDVSPGGNKATIKFANGKTINLSAAKSGIIISANGTTYDDGTPISNGEADVSGIATITTPNGGEYQVVLQDGTKVWLNAASTLLYPTTFQDRGARRVELRSGEAYFQVTKDSKRPFVVKTRSQDVTVLGTTFNINAYSDQPQIKTTLVEGSVKVALHSTNSITNSKVIKPGEQAILQNGKIAVSRIDLGLETAWKDGKIQFENADLKTVMAMLQRWYDIEVEYAYYPTGVTFSGNIARSKNISEILELIQSTGDVHYKIEGRKVLLMK